MRSTLYFRGSNQMGAKLQADCCGRSAKTNYSANFADATVHLVN